MIKRYSTRREAINASLLNNKLFKFTYILIIVFFYSNFTLDWADQAVPKPEILRLIFQGRFLHGNVTLGSEYFVLLAIMFNLFSFSSFFC